MKFFPLRRTLTIVFTNSVALVVGITLHADEIETPERVLLADMFATTSPSEAEASNQFSTNFGIRKGRGIQLVRPIEVNDRKYELNLSGPILKSGTKKKSFGLSFELRF